MLSIVLASMLLHISWSYIVNRFMYHDPEGARRLVMLIPGLAIMLAFIFKDHDAWMVWFFLMSVISYIVGVVAAHLPPK